MFGAKTTAAVNPALLVDLPLVNTLFGNNLHASFKSYDFATPGSPTNNVCKRLLLFVLLLPTIEHNNANFGYVKSFIFGANILINYSIDNGSGIYYSYKSLYAFYNS